MVVKQASPGKGFDVNQPLNTAEAALFKSAGNDFCIRYLPRTPALVKGNLTGGEVNVLLGVGLAVGAVQHCPLPGWEPDAQLGTQYGQYASAYAKAIGLPSGMNIWLDIETPAESATAEECIDYCEAWWNELINAGYKTGLYIGYGVPLTAEQLYLKLPFSNYWKAYNYDDGVYKRGFQIVQHNQQVLNGISFDPNTMQADELSELPMLLYP